MNETEIVARTYEILFNKYKKIYLNSIRSLVSYFEGPDFEKMSGEFFEDFTNPENYAKRGIATEEDLAILRTLEYILGVEKIDDAISRILNDPILDKSNESTIYPRLQIKQSTQEPDDDLPF